MVRCQLQGGVQHLRLTLTLVSPPPVARIPDGWKSTEYMGSFPCHTICTVLAFIELSTQFPHDFHHS